jgi:hypothetical protein
MKATPPNQFRLSVEQARKFRIPETLGSDESYGMNGFFFVPYKTIILRCLVSDGASVEDETGQWEHVSVSIATRIPTWEEMCFVKDLFFDDHEVCVQYHPAKADYVNNHPNCLHIWRPKTSVLPAPPSILVGIKGLQLRA